jgi:glycosyltransferase involved in cell wall biosynthesis
MPKVSVLIPTYNYAHYLDEAIQSVLNQSLQDFELIIVDNCSTDNTDIVVEKYLSDRRVRYYKNPANFGHVGNWNICLTYAQGEYLKFLCADDKFRSDCLEKFVYVMEQNPNVSLAVCNKQMFGKSSVTVELPLQKLHSGKEIIYHTLNTKGWLGEPTCVMFRRSNLHLGNFKAGLIWLPDWEMWLRQLTVGDCYIIPEPIAYVRNHSHQITKMVMRQYINCFEEYELCKAIKEDNGYHIDKTGIDMDRVLKRHAEKCAAAMYKLLPRIYRKRERSNFFKGLKIAITEHVVLNPLLNPIMEMIKEDQFLHSRRRGLIVSSKADHPARLNH